MIQSDSNKPMVICLQRETPLSSFNVVSTHRFARSIPLFYWWLYRWFLASFSGSTCLCGSLSSTLWYLFSLDTLYVGPVRVSHGSCLSPLWYWFLLNVLLLRTLVSSTYWAPWFPFSGPSYFSLSFFQTLARSHLYPVVELCWYWYWYYNILRRYYH